MAPLGLFYPRTEWLPWSCSILGQNDSPGVLLSWNGMTPLEPFHPRTKWFPWSRSIPGQNDSPGVIPSQDRMTPLESFHPRTEWLLWSRFITGQNDSPGVVTSQDRMSPLESFYARTEGLPWSCSIPGQNDSPGRKLSDSEWVLLETLCAVHYEEKLVPFQTCAAWNSCFNKVFFWHCQVLHRCNNYTTKQFCKPTELLTMPFPVVNLFLWLSMSGLWLSIACSTP